MAVFDCFQYFNEDHILDLRFNILNQYVDFFVISESTKNHQGKEKKLNFKINNFKRFEKKIIYLVANPNNNLINKNHKYGHSMIEQHQRDYLANGLTRSQNNDLILISDSDEIPNLSLLNKLKKNKKYFCFSQKAYCYSLNLHNPFESNWMGTRACLKKDLVSPHKLRQIKFKKYPFWRLDKKNIQVVENGGWHFSYLTKLDKISEKIKSFSHDEFNVPENTEAKHLQQKIDAYIHPTNNNKLTKVKIDNSFPKYIIDNQNKLKEWIV